MFRFSKILPLAIIVVSSLLVASCKDSSGDTNGDSTVAAKVGSHEITLKQVDSTIKQQLDANGGGAALSPAELVAARLSVLDNLIQEETLYQKAQRENLVPDENKVNQEVQKIKQQAGISEDQFQAQLKQAGLTEEEFRDRTRRSLAIKELQDREKTRVTAPTDAEIEKYYNDNIELMKKKRGVDIAIIVADPMNNGATDDAVGDQAAESKIKAIYEQLKSGLDFATLARQRSEHQSAVNGGNLGFGDETALKQLFPTRPEVVQRLFSMTPGQYTEPIKDNLGGQWVIFKLNAKSEQETDLTLNDVRKNIIDAITQQRQQILWNALVLVAMSEVNTKNYLAERIVQNPKAIVEMQPSNLLKQSAAPQSQQQPQPRVENENQNQSQAPASNANR